MESWSSVFAFAVWARKQIVRLGELIQPIFAMPTGEGTPRRSTRRLIGALPEFRYGCVIDS
jgi:hypothetical protein